MSAWMAVRDENGRACCPTCRRPLVEWMAASPMGLTERQHALLQYISAFIQDRGFPPSFAEMARALALHSKSGIHRLIKGIEERGYIKRLPNRPRAIEIVGLTSDRIAA